MEISRAQSEQDERPQSPARVSYRQAGAVAAEALLELALSSGLAGKLNDMVRITIAGVMICVLAAYAAAGAPKAAAPKMAPDGTPIGDRPVLQVAFDERGQKPKKGDDPFSPGWPTAAT